MSEIVHHFDKRQPPHIILVLAKLREHLTKVRGHSMESYEELPGYNI